MLNACFINGWNVTWDKMILEYYKTLCKICGQNAISEARVLNAVWLESIELHFIEDKKINLNYIPSNISAKLMDWQIFSIKPGLKANNLLQVFQIMK